MMRSLVVWVAMASLHFWIFGTTGVSAIRMRRGRWNDSETEKQNTKQPPSFVWRERSDDLYTLYHSSSSADSASSSYYSSTAYMEMVLTTLRDAYQDLKKEIQPVRDIWDGAFSALNVAWKGYYEGFWMLLEGGMEGLRQQGLWGFLTGTATGVVYLASMTTSGVLAGMYQALRGLDSTREAIRSVRDGKLWDSQNKEWFHYSLDDELLDQLSSTSSTSSEGKDEKREPRRLRKQVKDDSFYQLLGIRVDASSAEIKKAYYSRALEVHPDKSSQEEAEAQFHELNAVYKTLVSEHTRNLYDRHGTCIPEDADESATIDSSAFFSILFGTGVVQPYVGDLVISAIVDNFLLQLSDRAQKMGPLEGSMFDSEDQARRQLEIAIHLRDKIESFVSGGVTVDAFTESCTAEATSLALAMDDPLQSEFTLQAIASGLMVRTSPSSFSWLRPSWSRPLGGWGSHALDATQNFMVVYDLEFRVRKALKEVLDLDPGGAGPEQNCSDIPGSLNVEELLDKLSVPGLFKLLWKFNANDISRTLREASKRVLDDCGNDHKLRQARANALQILGSSFDKAMPTSTNKSKYNEKPFPNAEGIQQQIQSALQESMIDIVTGK